MTATHAMNAKQKLILLILVLTLMLGLVWAVQAKGITVQVQAPAETCLVLLDDVSGDVGTPFGGFGEDGGGFYHLSRVAWNS
jgi:hypothetical protein